MRKKTIDGLEGRKKEYRKRFPHCRLEGAKGQDFLARTSAQPTLKSISWGVISRGSVNACVDRRGLGNRGIAKKNISK